MRLIPARAFLVFFALYVLGFYVVKAFGIMSAVAPLSLLTIARVWQETAQGIAVTFGIA